MARRLGEEDQLHRGRRELSGTMEVFYNMTIVAVTQRYTFVKTNQTVHFKLVNFILYSIQIIPNRVDKK